jgi:thymidylate synthase (FAD)
MQSKTNKQGGDGYVTEWPSDPISGYSCPGQYLTTCEQTLQENAREVYEERLKFGVAREQARKDLPLSTYTELYWKMDLRNLLGFMKLRCDGHAQLEIRLYSNVIAGIVKALFPLTYEAWFDYSYGAATLSRQERILLKSFFTLPNEEFLRTAEMLKLGKRELQEFLEKMKEPPEDNFSLENLEIYHEEGSGACAM